MNLGIDFGSTYTIASLYDENNKSLDALLLGGMTSMFFDCENLKKLDVSRFETSGVEFMAQMFGGCKALKELDVSGFKLDKVQNTDLMFYDCGVLGNPDIENFIDTLRIRDILSGRG